ncbi:hypothetical protein [Paraburkholderia rhizosphaerae]|uniref:DUF4148 domain-containing protein n=1 Tax=Paraburkholderia rhizosphaerae TaxID=480658 RepID=A0A4R8LZM9_9BURK|nr:hypothetical protein [Paraburkholderia rhizosphaerae]TDY52339.1 hypothetical protein BX592_105223 [Paraburkholderia rhizosphaerae]
MTRSRLIPIARSLAVAGALCALSAPVFASGYGPSPYYQPGVGAPVSQRGISAQTLAAEQKTGYSMNETDTADATQRDVADAMLTAGDKH